MLMSNLQTEIIRKLGVKPEIDVQSEIRARVDFLKEHVKKAHSAGLLISISGGLDSAVAAALCKQATDELAQETGQPYETLGVFQPCGEQSDIADSYEVADAIQLKNKVETNIEDAVDEIAIEVEYAMKELGVNKHVSVKGKGNIKARTRMVYQYALAFERNLLVVGTDHASEIVTGFFTKYGDGAVDLQPLASLTKRQVKMLAEALGIPRQVIEKTPTAGLWEGQTDEEELGLTYDQINDYLEGKEVGEEASRKIEKWYMSTEHKRAPIPRI